MHWEELTSDDFARAARETGVCLIGVGVVERHGMHLPLGTDYINCQRILSLAAEKEPAVVFPPFYWGQIYEARCYAGTLTLPPILMLQLFEAVFDEIGRNGFKKIVLVSGHGGNRHLLPFLTQCTLWQRKPYSIYMPPFMALSPEGRAEMRAMTGPTDGHAGDTETSTMLAHRPELVHMERIPEHGWEPEGRMNHLPQNQSGVFFYADHPQHYGGDAKPASAAKGERMFELMAESLAQFVAAVKADRVQPALEDEFFRRADSLGQ